eukprot:PhF_6_TR532/c0_g2_i9/m.382
MVPLVFIVRNMTTTPPAVYASSRTVVLAILCTNSFDEGGAKIGSRSCEVLENVIARTSQGPSVSLSPTSKLHQCVAKKIKSFTVERFDAVVRMAECTLLGAMKSKCALLEIHRTG